MIYFAVVRARGEAWDHSRGLREQAGWDEHADFMEALVRDGFIVLGGLLGEDERALLVVNATSEAEVEVRLADDPWPPEMLRTVSIERWEVLLDGR